MIIDRSTTSKLSQYDNIKRKYEMDILGNEGLSVPEKKAKLKVAPLKAIEEATHRELTKIAKNVESFLKGIQIN